MAEVLNATPAQVERRIRSDGELVHRRDAQGKTALHWASGTDRVATVRLLLDHGADVNTQDHEKETALCVAARLGCNGAVQVLLQAGADPNLADADNQTPLDGAAYAGHFGVMSSLLDQEATIVDDIAVVSACSAGHVSIVRLLLDRGTDINMRDERGFTPLLWASNCGHANLVRLLIERKADLFIKEPSHGMTAIDLAAVREHRQVVGILKNAMSQEMLDNIVFKDLVFQQGEPVRDTHWCNGCFSHFESSESYYKCKTCDGARQYCAACVLHGEQVANQICPNHVLAHIGTSTPSPSNGVRVDVFENMTIE